MIVNIFDIRTIAVLSLLAFCLSCAKNDETGSGIQDPVLVWKQKLPGQSGRIMTGYGNNLLLQRILAIDKKTGNTQWTLDAHWELAAYHRLCDSTLLFQDVGLHTGSAGMVNMNTGKLLWKKDFGNPQVSPKFPVTCMTPNGNIFYTSDYGFHRLNVATGIFSAVFNLPPMGVMHRPFTFTNTSGNEKVMFGLPGFTGANQGIMLWDVRTEQVIWQNPNIGIRSTLSFGYDRGNIYVSNADTLYKISEMSGTISWKVKLENPEYSPGAISIRENRLYYQNNTLRCYDVNTGNQYWSTNTAPTKIMPYHDWVVGIVQVPSNYKDYLVAIHSVSGKSSWKINSEANITSFFADPLEKRIYVTDSNEYLYCFEVP
jgi:outer membrane protein assembly factor BamB